LQTTAIGVDLAKHLFQVHGVDASGQVAVRRNMRRSELLAFFRSLSSCLVGMEACATAHHWARKLTKLGHTVSATRTMQPMLKRSVKLLVGRQCGSCR
jgi:transposase